MKYRLLFALPLVCALALALVEGFVVDATGMHRVVVLTVKALAAGGAAAAALRFLPGDYLRWAWMLEATCYALLLAKDLLFGVGSRATMHAFPAGVAMVRGTLTLAANAAGVAGALLLARAWQVAGIMLPGSPVTRRLVFVSGVLVAIAIAGQATLEDLRGLVLHGEPQRLVSVASDLGDILAMSLLAPVVLTAIALRGGLLAWPWTLFAASQLGWLIYDAAGVVGGLVEAQPLRVTAFEDVARSAACLFAFASVK